MITWYRQMFCKIWIDQDVVSWRPKNNGILKQPMFMGDPIITNYDREDLWKKDYADRFGQ